MTAASKAGLALELVFAILAFESLDYVTAFLLSRAGLAGGVLPVTGLWFIISTVSFVFVLLITYFSQKLRGQKFVDYGLGKEKWPGRKTLFFLVFGSLIMQLISVYGIEKPAAYFFHVSVNVPPVKSIEALLFFLVTGIIGGGCREELFFRGYLINKLTQMLPANRWDRAWNVRIAAVFQILLFSYGHIYQGWLGAVESVLFAAIFTMIYLRTGSLWSAVIFHCLADVWGILAIYFGLVG